MQSFVGGTGLEDDEAVYLSDSSANGWFYWDDSSTATEDEIDVVKITTISIGRFLRLKAGNLRDSVSVKDFGATGLETGDDTTAIQDAINSVPDNDTSWSGIGRATGGTEIYFPETNEAYVISSQIEIPATKSIRLAGPGANMVRLKYTGAGDSSVLVKGGQRSIEFEGLLFHQGGIEFEGNCRISNTIKNCMFSNCTGYGIKTLGASCVSFNIEFCFFSESAGGISIGYQDSDLWNIRHCSFVRNSDVDVLVNTTGVKLEYCDFETRVTANSDKPSIHFVEGYGLSSVEYCRFGDEDITTNHPPAYNIVCGPLSGTSTTPLNNVRFENNDFRGTNGTPSATNANSAIKLSCPVYDSQILDNNINAEDYFGNLIEEAFFDNTSPNASRLYGNVYRGVVGFRSQNRLFSQEGIGWDVQGQNEQEGGENTNYISQDLSAWINSNTTDAQDAAGPDGVASSATTLTKTASGSSATFRSASTSTIEGDHVFSVWLKAGTATRARIFAQNGGSQLSSNLDSIVLTSEWKRYYVPLKNVNAGTTATCYVAIGTDADNDNLVGDTILVFDPQLEKGTVPTENMPNTGTEHASRQMGGSAIGPISIGYGTTAPVSGRYEVGDITYNTAPSVDGNNMVLAHWVCTVAGSPGTHVAQYLSTVSPAT
jgi:hypothetical protein